MAQNDEDFQISLEDQGYAPTMLEINAAVRTLNAARFYLSAETLGFAAGQGMRVCPMIYGSSGTVSFLKDDWVQTILDAGDMLNAALQAYPFLTADWCSDFSKLEISIA
ncbi:hypothetical protein [Roseicitreum antarcticum]|uniref:Uncharacterized protein n=1 Tax=Roseicitreum antarcticum TaxID=564137 RepID=A0A1H2U9Z2_9RHOB|nr:hypothetical protein [Roseicitreum antarcticum]SDW52264.1 hypothetical protein SAMN04488238_102306 [Roseicitreum antarcticum]